MTKQAHDFFMNFKLCLHLASYQSYESTTAKFALPSKMYGVISLREVFKNKSRGFLKNQHACFELSQSIESSLRSLSTL